MKYIRLKEYCAWESETWTFYIPHNNDINTRFIAVLRSKIEQFDLNGIYKIIPGYLKKEEVDILVKNQRDGGYMAAHQPLSGLAKEEDIKKIDDIKDGEELDEILYKGGIRNFFNK